MRLAASLRYSLYAVTAVVFASGIAWLAARYVPVRRALPEGLASASMRVHGGAAMALLVLIGGAVALHTTNGWRERKNRASSVALSSVLIAITVTGYLLYYLGDESWRATASLVHWWLGLALPFLLAGHAWLGRYANGRIG
jgi:hypothetical protein